MGGWVGGCVGGQVVLVHSPRDFCDVFVLQEALHLKAVVIIRDVEQATEVHKRLLTWMEERGK